MSEFISQHAENQTEHLSATSARNRSKHLHDNTNESSDGLLPGFGNQAAQTLLHSGMLQAKLKISHPTDRYEIEADRVADQVMRMPDSATEQRLSVSDYATDNQLQRCEHGQMCDS